MILQNLPAVPERQVADLIVTEQNPTVVTIGILGIKIGETK